jgi:hypothetical protein
MEDRHVHHFAQVITRTSGLQLGIISHFLVDPRTVSVIYLQLRAKGLGGDQIGVVSLSALTQIADVVLVHDESVVEDELRSGGLAKLVGYSVQSYDGTPLGKVGAASHVSCCLRVLTDTVSISLPP